MAIFTRRNALIGWWVVQSHRIARRMLKIRSAYMRRKGSALVALAAASLAGAVAFVRGRRRED